MSLNHVDLIETLRLGAERRIEEAMKRGIFDNLPGSGQPLPDDDMPVEENARLNWWALRILKQNDFIPHEVRWRKIVDQLKSELNRTSCEDRARKLIAQINEFVRKVNTLGTNAIDIAICGVDEARELQAVRARRAPQTRSS